MNGYGNSVFLRTAWEVSSGGTPPANTVAPVISGTQVVGSTLTSTTGTWTGIPAPTFTYQWFRGATLIGGATSSTYVLVQADAGNTSNITCKVTGTNAFGNATATSNTLAQIFDFDANTFITSAVITDATQKAATNSLTIDLKGYNVWSKMKALYPMVGGTATSMKWNLKDPRDLDAAFRLTFAGGGTWSSTGYTPNGTNGYADTKLRLATELSATNLHTSYYSRTNVADNLQYDCGLTDNTTHGWLIMRARTAAGNATLENGSASFSGAVANSQGLYIGTSTASNAHKIYKNGSTVASSTTAQTRSLFNNPQYFGAAIITTGGAYYSTRQLAFASVGSGLNDAEAANFYTAVQTFQTTLGRQV